VQRAWVDTKAVPSTAEQSVRELVPGTGAGLESARHLLVPGHPVLEGVDAPGRLGR
jgi:hypothetical protein